MNIVSCKMSAGHLLAYLDAPAQHPAVEAHLATCPVCRGKLARLAATVLVPQTDQLPCDECEARLPEYVQAQVEGRDPAVLFPEVASHLAGCSRCRRLSNELLAIGDLVGRGDLPRAVSRRPPDLSFLPRAASPRGRLAVPDRFREIVRRGAWWAQDQVQGLFLDLAAFSQPLSLQPAPAWVARGEGTESEGIVYQVALGPESLEDLDVEVTVYHRADQPGVARVVVRVIVPSRLVAGFAGSQIEMKAGQLTRSTRTDDDGLAVFEEVPLADLHAATFTITPP